MSKRIIKIDPGKAKIVDGEITRLDAKPILEDIDDPSSGVDLKDLLGKTRTILRREISNLLGESAIGLLSKDSSQSLVNYIKLLKELIREEDAIFDDMSDEELEALLKEK